MNGRDWNSIGDAPSLPRWLGWAALPVAIPLAGMAWLAAHWEHIPLRYGPHGMTRTPLHVYALTIFGAGLAALLLADMLIGWYGSGRRAVVPALKILLAVSYLISTLITAISVTTVLGLPAWPLAAAIPVAALAVMLYVVRAQHHPDLGEPATAPECWSTGGIYSNPNDPALFVPARIGHGYTLNMANPMAYPFLALTIGGALALAGFLYWALR